jgi:hypothetical protein
MMGLQGNQMHRTEQMSWKPVSILDTKLAVTERLNDQLFLWTA